MSLRDYLFHEEPGIQLFCGDCRDVLPLLEPLDAAVIVTDPPYGIAYKSGALRSPSTPDSIKVGWLR